MVRIMKNSLQELLEAAKLVTMTREEEEAQRLSFAYGNAHIENEFVTRETVAEAAKALKAIEEQSKK